jgi:hypothetical protein
LFKIKPIFVIDSKTINFVDMKSIIIPSTEEINKSYVTINKDGNDFIVPLRNLLGNSTQPLYVYKAIINQESINPPIAEVLVNTFPTGNFVYNAEGIYRLDLGVDLTSLNVTTISQTLYSTISGDIFYVFDNGVSLSQYRIETIDSSFNPANDLLRNYTLIIEAYAPL